MTKTEFDVMREALGQYISNQTDFVDGFDDTRSEEYKKESAKLAAAEKMMESLELNITGLANLDENE